jgi:hypothetical protein
MGLVSIYRVKYSRARTPCLCCPWLKVLSAKVPVAEAAAVVYRGLKVLQCHHIEDNIVLISYAST